MICSACQQRIDVPGYGRARHLDRDGGPHICPPLELPVGGERWFVAQGLAEPPQADSRPLTSESYTQGALGKWSRATERRENRGKGGISL